MCQWVFYDGARQPHPVISLLKQIAEPYNQYEFTSVFNEFAIDFYLLSDDPNSRVIAIDFDNTITADVTFYCQLIRQLQQQHWQPIVCTVRDDSMENVQEIRQRLADCELPIYATSGQYKREYLQQQGITVGLWIDDMFPCVSACCSELLRNNAINY